MYEKDIFLNSKLIAKVVKNSFEEIRVLLLKNNMIDLRIYLYFPEGQEPRPTKKGVWLASDQIPKIVKSLNEYYKNRDKDIDLELDKSEADSGKIRVYTAKFKNALLVHVRTFYLKNNEYNPGKGISFPIELIPKVAEALQKVTQ
ncbi:MAG: transcriptional coactivator p15/PC4 family protein [Endomicrobiales bacterium]|nr:transcriptional coactivator p15/PC4 family protein [Endomicrobiales bacterium]